MQWSSAFLQSSLIALIHPKLLLVSKITALANTTKKGEKIADELVIFGTKHLKLDLESLNPSKSSLFKDILGEKTYLNNRT